MCRLQGLLLGRHGNALALVSGWSGRSCVSHMDFHMAKCQIDDEYITGGFKKVPGTLYYTHADAAV